MTGLEAFGLLAHSGAFHWYDFVLYLTPLAIVVVVLLRGVWEERRRRRRGDGGSDTANR